MPRPLRREFKGAVYHVMNRGDRREEIFRDDLDRHRFLETLAEACAKTDWQVHALCLMGNHFHLVVETPKPNLVEGMKWFLGTYTARFNCRHRVSGHLFAGRYKAVVVDADSAGYFLTVCDYVHLNPVRAGLIGSEQRLGTYRWSSFAEYLKPPSSRWPWLRVDRLMGEMGLESDTIPTRKRFESAVESRRTDTPEDWELIRRGWYFGGDMLKEKLLDDGVGRLGRNHLGKDRDETEERKAERIVAEELGRLVWTEDELGRRRKGDPEKIRIARRLRAETTRTLTWIARRLAMGSWTHVSNLLRTPPPSV